MRKPDYPLVVKPRKLEPCPKTDEMFLRASTETARRVCALQTDRKDCAWTFKAVQLIKASEFLNP